MNHSYRNRITLPRPQKAKGDGLTIVCLLFFIAMIISATIVFGPSVIATTVSAIPSP